MEIKKTLKLLSILTLFCTNLWAHTIYAPNDIPLLDNRFRLDPKTKEVTIALHHSTGQQDVVLIRPNGSKIFKKKHPDNVAWVSNETEDIITITDPMVGPWQAVAKLDGDNRISLITPVKLSIKNLPLKLYSRELITTTATLNENGTQLKDVSYLNGAKLSISLMGETRKKVYLYKDNGKKYDQLPFDGQLTAHLFIDLVPGRYLLNIFTKNDIFIRAINKDAVVFATPVKIQTIAPKTASEVIQFKVNIDEEELIPTSVIIHGNITEKVNSGSEQIIITGTSPEFTISKRLTFGDFLLKVKVAATTVSGREIEIQLADQHFTLISPETELTRKKALQASQEKENIPQDIQEEQTPTSLFWIILSITFLVSIVIAIGIVLFIKKRIKNKSFSNDQLSEDEQLKEEPINLDKL